MSAVTLAPRVPDQCRAGGDYRSNPGGGVNPTYLLTAPTYGAITGGTISNENEDDPNPAAHHSSGLSPPPPRHYESIMETLIPPRHIMEGETIFMTMMITTTSERLH